MLPQAAEDALLARLVHSRGVRIIVTHTEGSAPRDEGTWMAVFEGHAAFEGEVIGTIGGGQLEHDAIDHARQLFADTSAPTWADPAVRETTRRYPLGPTLGQCCGGVVTLRFDRHDASTVVALRDALRREHSAQDLRVALFGGGHVGQAIARALAPLPVQLHWIDSREGVFPDARGLGLIHWPRNIVAEHSDPVQTAVRGLAAHSHVLIMSFSHAEDLDIVVACLQRQRERADLPFVGLIGSKSKRAAFMHRLEARGFSEAELAHITCPIGLGSSVGKEPAVIAAGVVAQIIQSRAQA